MACEGSAPQVTSELHFDHVERRLAVATFMVMMIELVGIVMPQARFELAIETLARSRTTRSRTIQPMLPGHFLMYMAGSIFKSLYVMHFIITDNGCSA